MSRILPAQLHVGDNVQALYDLQTPYGIVPSGSIGVVTFQGPEPKYRDMSTWIYFPGLSHDWMLPGVKTSVAIRKLPKKESKLGLREPNIGPAPKGCAAIMIVFVLGFGLTPLLLWLTKST